MKAPDKVWCRFQFGPKRIFVTDVQEEFSADNEGTEIEYVRADVAGASDLREKLAKHAHDTWAGWMRYMFSRTKSTTIKAPLPEHDTELEIVPQELVERWTRQAATPYADLPEDEKESDREIADKILSIVRPQPPAVPVPEDVQEVISKLYDFHTWIELEAEEMGGHDIDTDGHHINECAQCQYTQAAKELDSMCGIFSAWLDSQPSQPAVPVPEDEKESDREIADRILEIIQQEDTTG